MTQLAFVMPGAAPATVTLADEEQVAIREHYTRWRRDRDGLGAPTNARDGA